MNSKKLAVVLSVLALALVLGLTMFSGGRVSAADTKRFVAPDGSDTANDCTKKKKPCKTVQHAVDVAAAGDTISLDKGTYVEQVTITKSLKLEGEDNKSIIKAPAAMAPDGEGKTNIIEITGPSTSVEAKHLTVAGPMPVCGNSGIAIIGGATLSIDHSAVLDIGPGAPNPACSGNNVGEGIRAGTQRGSSTPQVGHIIVSDVDVLNYNRNGIVVSGIGSTGDLNHNTIRTSANAYTVPNGVIAINGGVISADHNKVSGNKCTISGDCGPSFTLQVQSVGILIYDSPDGSFSHNDVSDNDIGIFVTGPSGAGVDVGTILDHNDASENLYVGIFVDWGAPDPVVSHNKTMKNGEFGIYVGSADISHPLYAPGAGSFRNNDAKDNDGGNPSFFDLFWDGTGTPTFRDNHCGTASPSKAAWDCK